ncbi:uncharacterized protein LOC144871314 [Branchiostoma floridae x Branchiostoma japonicum]
MQNGSKTSDRSWNKMAISDPLLRELQTILKKLKEEPKPITDYCVLLKPLCETLERILRKGLKQPGSLFGINKRDYWSWMESTPNYVCNDKYNPFLNRAIDLTKSSPKLRTLQGRGRCFIRLALAKKIVSVPVEHLLRNARLTEYWYDSGLSIIANPPLGEALMALLFALTDINFELDIKNASFLDESWVIPVYKRLELVPCTSLGMTIRYLDNRIFVVKVEENGVAGEDNKIEPGDIVDELYQESLYGCKQGKVNSLLREHQGWPVYVSVIKCRLPDGTIYPPLVSRIKKLKEELKEFEVKKLNKKGPAPMPAHALLPQDYPEQAPVHDPEGKAEFNAKYVGQVSTGRYGDVAEIESAVEKAIEQNKQQQITENKEVHVELTETEVIITDLKTNKELSKHSYTEISSCGRRSDMTKYFAFIAGDTQCSVSRNFTAFVFEAESADESKIILCSIAQGFGRTSWFV